MRADELLMGNICLEEKPVWHTEARKLFTLSARETVGGKGNQKSFAWLCDVAVKSFNTQFKILVA